MKGNRFNLLLLGLGILFAGFYTAEGFLFREFNLDEFQVATGYLKDRDDSLYSRDFIWKKKEMIQNLHVCVRGLMRATDFLTGEKTGEPIDLFLLWLPAGFLLFYMGNYLLALRFSDNRWAALLVACAFMAVRRTPWDWWGMGGAHSMSARGIVLSVLPLGLWAFFWCEDNLFRLGGLFILWGVVSNFHPLSGWGFVEFLGITLLVSEGLHPRTFLKVGLMGTATLLGSLPFLLIWKQVAMVPESERAPYALIKRFWDFYHGFSLPTANYALGFLQDFALPFLLALAGYFFWRLKRPVFPSVSRTLVIFPWVVVGMTSLVIAVGHLLQKFGWSLPVLASEHCRNFKMIYLTLPVWMGFAFACCLQSEKNRSFLKIGISFLAVLGMLIINFPGHKLARYVLWSGGWLSRDSVQKFENESRERGAEMELAHWAREKTPKDALFYFDSYEFRYYARRSLVFCKWDRPCVAFHPTREMVEWSERNDRILPLRDRGDTQGMLALAREYHADYLVIVNSWAPLSMKPVWSNKNFSVFQVHSPG